MSGNSSNNYGYYYPPPPPPPSNYQEQQAQQQWNSTSLSQQQYAHNYPKNAQNYYGYNANNHGSHNLSSQIWPPPPQFLSPAKFRMKRFNRPGNNFSNQQHNRLKSPMYNGNKRPRMESPDVQEQKTKSSRKKKKPLSQNVPSIRSWTPDEAVRAFAVEKEYNKHSNDHSLIIRFPDLTLNKDIVSKFHPAIDSVHFQQPSTARYCYVTLDENADAESVISALNKQKFGNGLLTADYKRDKEEEQNIGPEDIDPLTLYVGNLAQDIIKEDLTMIYPKAKRIDIGFAKKMKFTRYAFVSYKTVDDCIEAFKKTHNTDLYARTLIVRFRRLHGTVGMPGEAKPQNATKRTPEGETSSCTNGDTLPYDELDLDKDRNPEERRSTISETESYDFHAELRDNDNASVNDDAETTISDTAFSETTNAESTYSSGFVSSETTVDDVDLNKVKTEPNYSDYDDNTHSSLDIKTDIPIKTEYNLRTSPEDAAALIAQHKPMVEYKMKEEPCGEEDHNTKCLLPDRASNSASGHDYDSDSNVRVKSEPDGIEFYEHGENSEFECEEDDEMTPNFTQIYNTMLSHKDKVNQLKKLASK